MCEHALQKVLRHTQLQSEQSRSLFLQYYHKRVEKRANFLNGKIHKASFQPEIIKVNADAKRAFSFFH